MTTDEYVLSEDEVRDSFVTGQTRDGYGADWDDLMPTARAEFDRFIAQVKRDAAREALDGLASQEETHCEELKQDPDGYHIHFLIADAATAYRDAHYPEETTP